MNLKEFLGQRLLFEQEEKKPLSPEEIRQMRIELGLSPEKPVEEPTSQQSFPKPGSKIRTGTRQVWDKATRSYIEMPIEIRPQRFGGTNITARERLLGGTRPNPDEKDIDFTLGETEATTKRRKKIEAERVAKKERDAFIDNMWKTGRIKARFDPYPDAEMARVHAQRIADHYNELATNPQYKAIHDHMAANHVVDVGGVGFMNPDFEFTSGVGVPLSPHALGDSSTYAWHAPRYGKSYGDEAHDEALKKGTNQALIDFYQNFRRLPKSLELDAPPPPMKIHSNEIDTSKRDMGALAGRVFKFNPKSGYNISNWRADALSTTFPENIPELPDPVKQVRVRKTIKRRPNTAITPAITHPRPEVTYFDRPYLKAEMERRKNPGGYAPVSSHELALGNFMQRRPF